MAWSRILIDVTSSNTRWLSRLRYDGVYCSDCMQFSSIHRSTRKRKRTRNGIRTETTTNPSPFHEKLCNRLDSTRLFTTLSGNRLQKTPNFSTRQWTSKPGLQNILTAPKQKGKIPSTIVLDMALNNLMMRLQHRWSFADTKYLIITIAPRFTLARNESTW